MSYSGVAVTAGQPERPWPRVAAVGPYVLLAVLTAFTVAMRHADWPALTVDLALCAATALWILGLVTLRPAARQRLAPMTLFLVGLAALMLVLVVRDPWFGMFAPAGYVYAFLLLSWPWRLAGVGAVAVAAGTAQATGVPKTTVLGVLAYVAVVAANVLPMWGLVWVIEHDARRKAAHLRALAEAREANDRLAETLAENAALHGRLLAQARAAGVRDERQRLAREIHDTLAQGLVGIVTQLQAAELAGDDPADPAGWRRGVAVATELARESLAEARRSVEALRPEPLQDAGGDDATRLGAAVARVAERWSERYGPTVQVTTTGTPRPLVPAAEAALLRAAQEALANVAKHAAAGRVGVTLSYLDGEVALDVRDDGRGFDAARLGGPGGPPGATGPAAAVGYAGRGGGFGLVAMRERIEALAGSVQVESEPGHGTGISARLPIGRAWPEVSPAAGA
jgi:signal transduction histidine kinase